MERAEQRSRRNARHRVSYGQSKDTANSSSWTDDSADVLDILWLHDVYDPLGFVIIAFVTYVAFSWRPMKLLAKTTYRTSRYTRYPRSIGRIIRFITFGGGARKTLNATCLWIEWGILHPRPEWSDQSRRAYRKELRGWNADAKSRLKKLVSASRDQEAIIEVGTCFDLYRAESDISQYLDVKSAVVPDSLGRFEAKVLVGVGFVAPLYLLGGLLPHYDEDWKGVIQEYGEAVDLGSSSLDDREVLVLQAFLFRCWLLWGPSIPIGKCQHWQGRQLLQFGYGDENNSVLLAVDGETSGNTWSRLTAAAIDPRPLAHQAHVTGNIELTTAFGNGDLCAAQHSAIDTEKGRIVIATTDVGPVGDRKSNVSGYYYSAYLWVIFVICDSKGKPLHAGRDRWRDLLTFFEHGNIAESSTCLALKHQLATKVMPTLELILGREPDITLHYACAIDDSGCGVPIVEQPQSGESIKEILFDHGRRLPLTRRERMMRRICATPPDGEGDTYAACRLSEIVDDYLRTLTNEQAAP